MAKTTDCLFCGLPARRAKEHVFPDWLLRAVEADTELVTFRHVALDGSERSRREHTLGAFTLGQVCAGCNNGWMSQLENEGRRVLAKLWKGKQRLASIDCYALVLWSLKTACVLNAASHYRRIVPPAHARSVREMFPPEGLYLDVAFRKTREKVSWLQCQRLTLAGDGESPDRLLASWHAHGYNISFAFAEVMLRLVWLPLEGYTLERVSSSPRVAFSRVWPERTRASIRRTRRYERLEDFATDAKAIPVDREAA